ncbi:MAG TPA: peroxide stress protein YaaA [Solirubrobacteraceae bacterium]|nr:peroxide stress protein YaaA [Solirubrobacteraceae bacterium]
MLVLLPPSEGKTAPEAGEPVDLASLAFGPALLKPRDRVLRTLARVSAGRPATALRALGLSAGQAGELAKNAALLEAPAGPASEVYTGVLYERLGLPSLDADARASVLIFSALWGVVRPDDRIPAYKLSMGAKLPRFATGLAAFWKPALTKALPRDGLVLDLRSGAYAAAWAPPASATVVAVRGFTEREDGSRSVVSHMVKATRGEVARLVLSSGAEPSSAEEIAELVRAAGHTVELTPAKSGVFLDVIERAPA